MLWQNLPGSAIGCGGLAAASTGIGFAFRRWDFHGAGIGGASVVAVLKHAAWIPASSLGWGVLLLAAGFVFLSAGVLVNLLLARRRARVASP